MTVGAGRRLSALMLLTHCAAGLLVRVAGPCTRETERICVASSPSRRQADAARCPAASPSRSLAGGPLRMRGGGNDRRNADGNAAHNKIPWGVVI